MLLFSNLLWLREFLFWEIQYSPLHRKWNNVNLMKRTNMESNLDKYKKIGPRLKKKQQQKCWYQEKTLKHVAWFVFFLKSVKLGLLPHEISNFFYSILGHNGNVAIYIKSAKVFSHQQMRLFIAFYSMNLLRWLFCMSWPKVAFRL